MANKKKEDERNKELEKFVKKFEKSQSKNGPNGGGQKTLLLWGLGLLTLFLLFRLMGDTLSLREVDVPYSTFKVWISKDSGVKIIAAKVRMKANGVAELHGQLASGTKAVTVSGGKSKNPVSYFSVKLPFLDSKMLDDWDKLGFQYSFEEEKIGAWDIMLNFAPIIVIILIWVFMFRQMQGGQKGVFSFGKSKAKIMENPDKTFADVAGAEEAKNELEEIIAFLKAPRKFKRLGGKIPKGVLLLGSPGTGKTLLAKAVAGEAGVPFLSMSGSDFVEMFVGVGASRVRDLFETAKKNSPSIIFIDEIDAVGRQRGAGLGGGHDEREQTLNQMLVEMDGFEENSGVILIAATNRPDVLDPALLRPGRFDRQVVVDIPDVKGREAILKVHVKNVPLADDVNLEVIAKGTPGFVGADLANLVNEAALLAARFGEEKVTMLDFEEAKDKVMMGTERRSLVLSEEEKKTTAYHEAGHAICSLHCEHADPLHKVTIIPRGRALGVTLSLPDGDKHSQIKEYLLDRVCVLMGGRVAEEDVFNIQTTGASNDIQVATDLARKLVCDFGMTEELGPISYGEKNEQIFLGREISRHRDYSEKTAELIDSVVKKIIVEQHERARKILEDYKEELIRLAEGLIEHEMLDREEIDKIISGEVLESAKKSRPMVPLSEMKDELDFELDNEYKEEIKAYGEVINKKHNDFIRGKKSEEGDAGDDTAEIKPVEDEKDD